MRKPVIIPVTVLLLLATVCVASAASDRVKVRATGQAPADLPNAREAAIEEALRQAVEVVGGVKLASLTEVRDFQLIKDVIYTQTAGLVETYKVTKENPDQEGLYTVRVEAIISRGELDTKLEAWKALIRRKGRPRLMAVGAVDKRPFDARLTAEMQGNMEERGLTIVDLDMLTENQRRDAERAAKGDLDPAKAALIIREVGADYFVVVSVEGTQYPPKKTYGVDLHTVDATGIVKILTPDSAEVKGAKVVSKTVRAQTSAEAVRLATSGALAEALDQAVGRLGAHWLEDVDQRGGQQVYVVADRFPFERLEQLMQGMRQAGGIKDIIVDATDEQGRSQFRVITNSPSVNVAAVLKQVDPAIRIATSSKYRIEITPAGHGSSTSLDRRTLLTWGGVALGAILVILALAMLLRRKPAT